MKISDGIPIKTEAGYFLQFPNGKLPINARQYKHMTKRKKCTRSNGIGEWLSTNRNYERPLIFRV